MTLNISAWAIRKPIPSIALFAVMLILGMVSFGKLPITRFPNIDVPIFGVVVSFPDSRSGRSIRYRFNTVEQRLEPV